MKRRRALLVVIVPFFALQVSWVQSFAQDGKSMKERRAEAKRTITEEIKRSVTQDEDPTAGVSRAINEIISEAISESTFRLIGTRLSIAPDQIVKGAPYSANAITEEVQTLADGNQIIKKREATYYRDSEGRIRIEQQLGTIGKWTAANPPPRMILISDPVAGHYYNLDPRSHKALKDPQGPLFQDEGEKARTKMKRELEKKSKAEELAEKSSTLAGDNSVMKPKESSPASKKLSARAKKESLGKQVMEGVEAEGTRSTTTIPAGEIGNTLPIEIVDELWYSPDLRMIVMTKHHDPRSGDVTWRLMNINRGEPDHSLFEIPADYTIIEKPALKIKTKTPENSPKPKRVTTNDL